jgi:hypothetical protein
MVAVDVIELQAQNAAEPAVDAADGAAGVAQPCGDEPFPQSGRVRVVGPLDEDLGQRPGPAVASATLRPAPADEVRRVEVEREGRLAHVSVHAAARRVAQRADHAAHGRVVGDCGAEVVVGPRAGAPPSLDDGQVPGVDAQTGDVPAQVGVRPGAGSDPQGATGLTQVLASCNRSDEVVIGLRATGHRASLANISSCP